jgi:hypothetical protein
MKKLLLVVAVGVLVAGWNLQANAYDQKGNYTVLAWGTKSCGLWMEKRATRIRENRVSLTLAGMESWIQGYLSSYNTHVRGTANIAQGHNVAGTIQGHDT